MRWNQALILLQLTVGVEAVRAEEGSPSPSASPVETPAPDSPLTEAEKNKLKSEYRSALRAAERAFDQRERLAQREFQAAQSAELTNWREQERKSRREYFEKHPSGPEQRKYVLGFVERKKEFDARQIREAQAERRSWRDKHEALRVKLKDRQKRFLDELSTGRRPSKELWEHLD
jgi:hypothetical protein